MIHERRGCTLLIRAKPQVLSRVWGLNVDDWRKEQGVLQKDAHDSPRRRNLPPPARDDLGPCPIGLESGKTSLLLVNTSRSMPRAILHLSAQAGCNTHVRQKGYVRTPGRWWGLRFSVPGKSEVEYLKEIFPLKRESLRVRLVHIFLSAHIDQRTQVKRFESRRVCFFFFRFFFFAFVRFVFSEV